ncbi:phosphatidate cytidylyltransferase [Simiduia curdlanivorans]|uniref:Phosphatidate cytidylyltransferase n=1 Tax=Simiduia curdlanivorans TaxID=1492769 RepID=A0ABV8UZA0_9GAMM|nr:phosphatidate cytidylyltransferase [Simiduia curdlanivorans]MDN3640389.1 phosphatidate cytidylyltransferase [Simiduia curdlanivorans]
MLKLRIITALLLVAVLGGALFYLPVGLFQLLLATAVLIATWEWSNLAGLSGYLKRAGYVFVTALAMAALAYFAELSRGLNAEWVRNVLVVGGAWWALALLWIQGYPSSAILWGASSARMVMGWLVLVPAWLGLCYLREQPGGEWLIVLVVGVVAGADIGGYFFGRAFGKRKLAPKVSPGKSWEGFWGGLGVNVLWACALGFWLGGDSWQLLLAIVVPASLVSVLGDLVESMLKRHRGIKDSSQLLPGHGGVLDRIDSITAAAPFVALGVLFTGFSFL